MFNWLAKNSISCVKAIRKRFLTKNIYPETPTKISYDIDNYEKILDGSILSVDKSLIIKDIIQYNSLLITRPMRWGKSLTLKMLESFFQPKFSSEGNIMNDDEKKEKFSKLLIGSKILTVHPFTGENKETKIIDLQGSLPVITLTFENIDDLTTKNKIVTSFRDVLSDGIYPHKYLLTSTKLRDKYNQELLKDFFSPEKENLTEGDITYTLWALIKSLNEHHNKKVIVLVDDYDNLLANIKLKRPDLYEYACTTYNNIFSIIKNDTDSIQLSVFMGLTQITKERSMSSIDHLLHDSIICPRTAKEKAVHFGFTEIEVEQLIKQAKKISKVKLDEDEIKEKLSRFYNGYMIQKKLIYNPYSVMHCLHNLVNDIKPDYENYSVNTGNPDRLIKVVKEHEKLEKIEEKKNTTTIEN